MNSGYRKILALVLLICANLFIWAEVFLADSHFLKVYFLDVGQGDSALIEMPSGAKILIDGGPDGSALRRLGEVLPFYERKIDAVILSHPDKDHIAGLPAVLGRYQVDFLVESGVKSADSEYAEIEKIADEKNIRKLDSAGLVLSSPDGAVLRTLFPQSDASGMETNTASIVAKLFYGKNSFLFTGDSPKQVEEYLAGFYGGFLKSDVLKVAHHGSRNSLSENFFSDVSPQFSVISAGLDNKYGHPHQEILDALTAIKSKILKTFEKGNIEFESDGRELKML